MRTSTASVLAASAAVALLALPLDAQRRRSAGRTGDKQLVEKFDTDGNGWLNREERDAARKFLSESQEQGRRRGRRDEEPPVPGPKVAEADVDKFAGVPLYDQGTLRTVFIAFENDDWEDELAAFYHTDVELPASVRVDGKPYKNVGIQFRGNSSFWTVSKGRKRSMSVTFDHVDKGQNLDGYRAMTLLNAHADPTFLRSVLYLDLVKQYLPAPKANYVRVVINGELWGIYINQQRYNKDFLEEAFGTRSGTRFKSSNRSRRGSLSYLGDDIAEYRKWYEIKSKDTDERWAPLMAVTRVLAETPTKSLEEALAPTFDIDGALRFLALDIVVQSGDGYWLHGSDYNMYVDPKGVLHMVHHDTNESFSAHGPRRGAPKTAEVDPFAKIDDENKALRNKLLAVPKFRRKYLEYVRDIARDSLDWQVMGPKIEALRKLIAADVAKGTRKLYATEKFDTEVFSDGEGELSPETIKGFFKQRRAFLLAHPDIKALDDTR
mgnify:FL=1